MTTTAIDTLINFLSAQMDGQQPPPENSAATRELAEAIEAIHKNPSDKVLGVLALRTLGAIIDRMRGGLASEEALRNFINPGRLEG